MRAFMTSMHANVNAKYGRATGSKSQQKVVDKNLPWVLGGKCLLTLIATGLDIRMHVCITCSSFTLRPDQDTGFIL